MSRKTKEVIHNFDYTIIIPRQDRQLKYNGKENELICKIFIISSQLRLV